MDYRTATYQPCAITTLSDPERSLWRARDPERATVFVRQGDLDASRNWVARSVLAGPIRKPTHRRVRGEQADQNRCEPIRRASTTPAARTRRRHRRDGDLRGGADRGIGCRHRAHADGCGSRYGGGWRVFTGRRDGAHRRITACDTVNLPTDGGVRGVRDIRCERLSSGSSLEGRGGRTYSHHHRRRHGGRSGR